jgi:hypothetical protein
MAFVGQAVVTAVRDTLLQVACWVESDADREDLRDMADQVGLYADVAKSECCPMCEEVRCDEGCPLAGVRAAGTA